MGTSYIAAAKDWGKSRRIWEDNIKTYLRKLHCEKANRFILVENRMQGCGQKKKNGTHPGRLSDYCLLMQDTLTAMGPLGSKCQSHLYAPSSFQFVGAKSGHPNTLNRVGQLLITGVVGSPLFARQRRLVFRHHTEGGSHLWRANKLTTASGGLPLAWR
jgi:hypothetical protein